DRQLGAIWIACNHSGLALAVHPDGTAVPSRVTIPGPGGSGTGSPTGVVFNTHGTAFHGDLLIFVTEDGIVAGATPNSASSVSGAIIEFDDSASGAVLKGVAVARASGGDQLYAADFHNGKIVVLDAQFHDVTSAGSFVDPNAPAGFAPFNVASIGSKLFVTY